MSRITRKLGSGLESLERREMMAADITFNQDTGLLKIQGDGLAENIALVTFQGSDVSIGITVSRNGRVDDFRTLNVPLEKVRTILYDGQYSASNVQVSELPLRPGLDLSRVDIVFNGWEVDDTFTNNSSARSTAYGGRGNDQFTGGRAKDAFFGGEGNDRLTGNGGNDSLTGGFGDDWLSGGDQDDLLWGNEGNDVILAGAGNDQLYGGADTDFMDGGADMDSLSGELGDDYLVGGDAKDHLDGGFGRDMLNGGEGNDFLYGGDGDDTLVGAGGHDYLAGNAGYDSLDGGDGDDTLDGGQDGNTDTLRGGRGRDRFYREIAHYERTFWDNFRLDSRGRRIENYVDFVDGEDWLI